MISVCLKLDRSGKLIKSNVGMSLIFDVFVVNLSFATKLLDSFLLKR